MLSLFYTFLLLAAGSNASPCKPKSLSPTSTGTPSSGRNITAGQNNANALSLPSSNSTWQGSGSIAGSSSTASTSAAATSGSSGGGSCPSGFINTVFNTGAPKNGGWPSTTWSSLTSNGVNDWIGFSLDTLDKKSTYGDCPTTPDLNAHQIHVVMDPTDTAEAVTMVQGASPPTYLELFNEPDFSFDGLTPLTDPVTAASNLQQLFSIPHPQTTYISPALMNANSDWLTQFNASCQNCFAQIPIIAMHVYNPSVAGVMAQITQLHGTWPEQKIWITELSPATSGCTMDASSMATTFINQLIPQIIALGYVEKIFWNSGEWDSPAINSAPDSCNPALTDANGNATPVLTALKSVCGGGSGGTATS